LPVRISGNASAHTLSTQRDQRSLVSIHLPNPPLPGSDFRPTLGGAKIDGGGFGRACIRQLDDAQVERLLSQQP